MHQPTPDTHQEFAGQVALVTGAARGIGAAVARALAQAGAAVVIADLPSSAGAATAAGLRDAGLTAAFVPGDVTADAGAIVADAHSTFGQLDILVNNAGIFYNAPLLTTDFAAWRGAFDVIFHGTLHCSRAAGQVMVSGGRGGRIVNISSVNAFLGLNLASHYNTAKGAVDQLTRCLAVEWAPHDILVNSVAPGFVDTPMAIVDGVNELELPEFQDIYVKRRRIPLARAAQPEEIAPAVLFLASPRNTYVTGHTLVVDGGLSITF